MLILHDPPSGDLSHIQAIGKISEGFALFDYVRIEQTTPPGIWIGQIAEPNQNVSLVGDRLNPTILHGLQLMQTHQDVQAVRSAQVFDILILAQGDQGSLVTPRLRPLPGSKVHKLNALETITFIELPALHYHSDGTTNVIGELLNADNVPLCIDARKFNYHLMVAGGTGSGKSNVCANLVEQAVKYGKCVLIHDAKPDYRLIDRENTDGRVGRMWERFEEWHLFPHGASDVLRVGFHGRCDPDAVDTVVAFNSSDFHPDLLAGLFFTGGGPVEHNSFEGFAGAADALYRQVQSGELSCYNLDQILDEVRRRCVPGANISPEEAIHEMTGQRILRKVNIRRTSFPWLDAVNVSLPPGSADRFKGSRLDGKRTVGRCDLPEMVAAGRVLVIDYSRMDDQSYAVLFSFFLRSCQRYRRPQTPVSGQRPGGSAGRPGIVQLADEAHRIFDNDSRHGGTLAAAFERVMREGRSADHSIILSLQNASQVPHRVMNNLNSKIVMRQNSREEADAATQTMGREFAQQAMRLGTGQAIVALHESRATVLAQMAPSPYELMRPDNENVSPKRKGEPMIARPSRGSTRENEIPS